MGCCSSGDGFYGTVDERNLSGLITSELGKDKGDVLKLKKILFLGSGGTGKSTVFKQLRQIHGGGFKADDKKAFLPHIYSQIINEMKTALHVYIDWHHRQQQREKEKKENNNENDMEYGEYDELLIFDNFTLESKAISNMESANKLMSYSFNKHCYNQSLDDLKEIISSVQSLWNEPVMKEIYNKRNITKIVTSSAHFWDKLPEIQESEYLPSKQDIMLCRLQTTGLHEIQFQVEKDWFNVIDVGGQKSQRRKWIHCFDSVVAIIFVASLSCYDEILHEDAKENAMVDQLELFDEICNTETLSKTAMILFLNKKDLFQQKHCVNKVPLNKCKSFKRYDGRCFDFEKAAQFINRQFTKVNKKYETREIFTHLTCATDEHNVQKVFADVQLIVISNSLEVARLNYEGIIR